MEGCRQAVAGNPAASETLLTRLSEEPDPEVRVGVIDNPNVPAEILERLRDDDRPEIRARARRRLAILAHKAQQRQVG